MISRFGISRGRLSLLLAGLAMFGPFSIDTIFPAFRVIAADYGVGPTAMQQTISVYLIAYAAMSLFHGPLSDAYGRKRVILAGVAVFALASVGCALAPDLTTLLVFRAVQGISAGAGLIVGRAVIRDCLDGHDAQRMLSTVSMIFGVAPAIAPIIGGWILGWSEWHAIFWFLALFAAALWLATLAGLPETHPPACRVPIRPAGLWHSNRAMLTNPTFLRLAIAGTLNFGALFLYIASAPVFVLDLMGLDEQQFAWFFAPTIAGMMIGAFVSGRMAGRVSGTRLANVGFAVCIAASALNIALNLALPDLRPARFEAFGADCLLPIAVLPISALAFGIALVFPVLTLVLLDMYPRQRGGASSMQAFVSLIWNAMVAGLLSPLVSHRGIHLAAIAAAFTLTAWWLWRGYAKRSREAPALTAEAPALEPTDRA